MFQKTPNTKHVLGSVIGVSVFGHCESLVLVEGHETKELH